MNRFIKDLIERYPILDGIKTNIIEASEIMIEAFKNGNTLFLCGNGGSAADSEHIAGELLKGFILKRCLNIELKNKFETKYGKEGLNIAEKLQYGFRALSLTSHPAFTSAFSNDVDGSLTFAQQLLALSKPGDVVMGITTSGNSQNIYNCLMTASVVELKSILLTGYNGGKCASISDCVIKAPGDETFKIQEYHLPIYHTLCMIVEDYFHG